MTAKKPACFVFGAGRPPARPPAASPGDLIVAADGGYDYLRRYGITADALVGDFDSVKNFPGGDGEELFVRKLPKEKDQTDLLASLCLGLERSYACFHIFGGTGGRLDHTLANIQCLSFLVSRGARGYLYAGGTVATAFEGEVRLAARRSGTVSLFAQGGAAEGVVIRGLKYELENACLTGDFPLGVSNAFTGAPAYIKAERGVLLLIYPGGTRELDSPSEFAE